MNSSDKKEVLLKQYRLDLLKALEYLNFSLLKVQKLPMNFKQLTPDTLESWESFSARYARCADMFTSQYLRTYISIEEPGFRGTTKDYLNKAEKLGLIDSAELWTEIRELRNMTAHEYTAKAFDIYIQRLFETAPTLLKLQNILSV